MQHLAYRVALARLDRGRVVVDAEGYRDRRREALERQADEAADDAMRYGRAVALDADDAPSERKQVHEYLRERGGVERTARASSPSVASSSRRRPADARSRQPATSPSAGLRRPLAFVRGALTLVAGGVSRETPLG